MIDVWLWARYSLSAMVPPIAIFVLLYWIYRLKEIKEEPLEVREMIDYFFHSVGIDNQPMAAIRADEALRYIGEYPAHPAGHDLSSLKEHVLVCKNQRTFPVISEDDLKIQVFDLLRWMQEKYD